MSPSDVPTNQEDNTVQRHRGARRDRKRSGLAFAMLSTLAGGTLFGTCEVRLHDAVVGASKATFLQLLTDSFGSLLPADLVAEEE